jgi:drug/metabolite transporter (DMT)-like permease
MNGLTWAAMALLALIWGGSFLAIHQALVGMGPLTLVAFRVSGAALTLWVVALLRGWVIPKSGAAWLAFAVMGLLNNVLPFSLIAWGQETVASGLAAILNAATAIFGVLIAAIFLSDERLTPSRALGVLLGFAGVTTAIGLSNLAELNLRALSQLAILAAAFCYGLSGTWARIRLKGFSPKIAALGMVTCSSLMMWPLALLSEGAPQLAYTAKVWSSLIYLAVVATATAYLLLYWILPRAGAGNTSLVTLLVAPVAIVLGALVLGEALPIRAYAGFGILALGLIILDGRAAERLAARALPSRSRDI